MRFKLLSFFIFVTYQLTIYCQTTPYITLQPVSQTVTQGQTVSFRVEATCSGPLGFQWWISGLQQNTGDKDGRITVTNTSNSSTITITNADTTEDSGNKLLCEVKNLNGYPATGYWINTNEVTLNVQIAASIVITYPTGGEVFKVGNNPIITYTSTGNSGFMNFDLSTNGGITWDTIATKQLDDGDYHGWIVPNTPSTNCKIRITDADGYPSATSNIFTIAQASTTPTITSQPQNQTVTEGQTATFSLTATCPDPIGYQWWSGSNKVTDVTGKIQGSTTNQLKILNTTSSDNGTQYLCEVYNTVDHQNAWVNSNTVSLTVNAIAPTITSQPQNQTVTEGQTATFSLTATCPDPIGYQWWSGANKIADISGKIQGATTNQLKILNTTSADNGAQYLCEVFNTVDHNNAWVNSNIVNLKVEYLAIIPSNQNVSDSSGSTTFSVTSNISWTASADAGWLSVSPTNGTNGGTITATYSANTSTSQRVGTIIVSGGGLTKTVKVTQLGTSSSLLVSPSNQDVSNSSGDTKYSVISNVIWTVSNDADWLSVTPTNGTNNDTLTASYSKNTSTSQRVGTITVSSGGGLTRTVTVTQLGTSSSLLVSPSNQDVSNSSGDTKYSVISNVIWTVSNDADWLSVTPTNGTNNDTLTASYSKNTSTSQRVGTITVSGGGLTRTVTVTQLGTSSSLLVSPSNQDVSNSSGDTKYSVISNVIWTVSDDADWLSVTPTNGTNNDTLTASYSKNTSTSPRVGTITVSGGGLTKTVKVTQLGTSSSLLVSPSNQDVSNSSGDTKYSVISNVIWTVSDDADWLSVTPTNGTNNDTLTASYSKNTSTSPRVGTITVSGGGLTKTVKVTQLGTSSSLLVSPSNQDVSNSSGDTKYSVISNVIWTVSNDADWLSVTPTNGTNNDTLTASYSKNTSTSQRVGTITVSGGELTRTVTVTQLGTSSSLLVSPSNQDVSNSSGDTKYSVISNVIWTVSDDADWLSVTPTNGTNNDTLTASYSKNTSTSQRVGTITVSGGGITRISHSNTS